MMMAGKEEGSGWVKKGEYGKDKEEKENKWKGGRMVEKWDNTAIGDLIQSSRFTLSDYHGKGKIARKDRGPSCLLVGLGAESSFSFTVPCTSSHCRTPLLAPAEPHKSGEAAWLFLLS